MKTRIGWGMFAAGLVLMLVFFITYDPNAPLKEAVEANSPPAEPSASAEVFDPAEVDSFLESYNPRYGQLEATWQTRQFQFTAGLDQVDIHQLAASRLALLSFAGNRNNINTILRLRPQLSLSESQDHQLAKARRLAALWPAYLPAGMSEILTGTLSDPEDLPARFSSRNHAAAILEYGSYLDVLADDLDLDMNAWSVQLHSVLAADRPLYNQLHRFVARTLADSRQIAIPELIPTDWLGSGPPGTVDRALKELTFPGCPMALPIGQSAWSVAVNFHQDLDLPPLPPDLLEQQPTLMDSTPGQARARLFILPGDLNFGVILTRPQDRQLSQSALGVMALADLEQTCVRAQLPPLLHGTSARAFALAIAHLYTLAGRSALGADSPDLYSQNADLLAHRLLREAVVGPVFQIPLAAGAYLTWLQDLNRGQLPPPVVTTRFWQYAAAQAKLAPPAVMTPELALPASAYGPDDEPARPLDDVLGWIIAHQLHRYICSHLLTQDVHTADYRHNAKVGDFLLGIMRQGGGRNW